MLIYPLPRWFGLILLPIVAWSADAWVTGVYFLRITIKGLLGYGTPEPPSTLAKARGIEMSVQVSPSQRTSVPRAFESNKTYFSSPYSGCQCLF